MLALGIPFLPCQIDNFRVVFSFLLFSVPLGAGLSLSLSLFSSASLRLRGSKQDVLRECNKSATRWKSRDASLLPFFPRHLCSGARRGNGQVSVVNSFYPTGPAAGDHFLLPRGEFSWPYGGVRHGQLAKRDCLEEDKTREDARWLNVHTAGWSFRSVKRVVLRRGRPGAISWKEKKKKRLGRFMQRQKQWEYSWRDEKISVDPPVGSQT